MPQASRSIRIASLQPSISITLDRLGCLDTLVACTKYCVDALPFLHNSGVHIIHDSWSASTEEILQTSPDLVLASVPYRMESLAAILKAGCPVLAFAPHSLADIDADTRLLGRIVDRSAAAEALIEEMHTALESVRQRSSIAPSKPLVYCEEWGKPLIHSQHWVAELVEAAGGRALGVPGAATDTETIRAADPDILIFAWCGAGDRVPLERIVAQRGWTGMRAAQQGRVYCVPDEWLNTPAPTLMHGLRALAAAIHPEIFGEIQAPRSLHHLAIPALPSKL
jgi:iron complex transport system substrate-binding protein